MIFQRHVLSKTFCNFPNDQMRTNTFRKEPIADQKVAEYKHTLQGKDN